MMDNQWQIVGYTQFSPDDLLVLPLFSRDGGNTTYAQFTFSSRSEYFELLAVQPRGHSCFSVPRPAQPNQLLYIGVRVGGNVEIVERSAAPAHVGSVEYNSLSDAAKIQYVDIMGQVPNGSHGAGSSLAIDEDDFSFRPTLSAQIFIDRAITNAKDTVSKSLLAREVVQCSRWVTDWTLSRVPKKKLDALLGNLMISRTELEAALHAELSSAESQYGIDRYVFHIDDVDMALRTIGRFRRQELRISQILRAFLLDGVKGREISESYTPKTKYEELVLPMIVQLTRDAKTDDSYVRELGVAHLIPKIFVKYFPIRRGRFIVDFLRVLGDFPIIKEQLVSIYERKCSTYGVKMYSPVIENLIEQSDDAASQLREAVH